MLSTIAASKSTIRFQANSFLLRLLFLIIGLGTLSFSSTSPAVRHIYLTWQQDTCRTMTITVHGFNTPDSLYLYYDKECRHSKISDYRHSQIQKKSERIQISDKRKIYHVQLKDLEPGTTYHFTVGDASRAFVKEQKFRTIPLQSSSLLFIEGGDWENTPEAEILAKRAAALSPLALFLGGDYPSRVFSKRDYRKWDQWLDTYAQTMKTPEGHLIPMVLAIGNHEVVGGFGGSKDKVPFYFDYFPQGETSESYFSLSFGKGMRLFVLDSGHAAAHGDKQIQWLKKALENAKDIPIKIALYHVPLYPSVRFAEKDAIYNSIYGIATLFLNAKFLYSEASHLGREHWLPLFDAYGLTVAFEHHDQALKRTKLLKNGQEDPHGTLYLGDGGWGAKLHFFPLQGVFYPVFSCLMNNQNFFWIVAIDDEKISYKAMNASGRIIDHFDQKFK